MDKFVEKIVKIVKSIGVVVIGFILLLIYKKIFIVLCLFYVNKKSRE